MTAGHRSDDQDAELDRLRRRYPRWRIWRGRATGDYWAMPPPGHPAVRELISSSDISELARRLAEAEDGTACELNKLADPSRPSRSVTWCRATCVPDPPLGMGADLKQIKLASLQILAFCAQVTGWRQGLRLESGEVDGDAFLLARMAPRHCG